MYAIVVIEVDAGHEARVRQEFSATEFAQVVAVSRRPRDTCVRLHVRCSAACAGAVVDRLRRCVSGGEIGRVCTRVYGDLELLQAAPS